MTVDPAAIASVAVHPAIGVARLGNAPGEDDWYPGPDTPGAAPEAPGGFRDASGRLKRQAARFRVFATLHDGSVVELTHGDGVQIEWRVQIANLKAGWYRFTTAMDLPRSLAVSSTRRNPTVGPDDVNSGFLSRGVLDIVPRPRRISGPGQGGDSHRFDDGQFQGKSVYLGELRTDDEGRLIVLGGRGETGSYPEGVATTTFANNDGWHDDIADGPVRASITVGGRRFEAEPGYVVVTPPNFGPGLFGVLTMDDVARDCFINAGWLQAPARPSFTRDIWPVFDRLTGNQWVNRGIFVLHGRGGPLDARDPQVIARLGDASPAGKPFREAVFRLFRDPADWSQHTAALPPFYGDGVDYAFGDPGLPHDTSADLSLTPSLHRMMGQWAAGDFDADWTGVPAVPTLDQLPPPERPEALDRANLHDMLGGPFHPGIELTWIMRRASLWAGPYRLKLAPEGARTAQDYGPELTPAMCLGPDGPLNETGPGGLTRWLGVPWQTDGGSCGSGGDYTPTWYLSSPSFWGARVPNDVLPQAAYERLLDEAVSEAQRAKHFNARARWYRSLGRDSDKAMITQWWHLGLVEPAEPPPGYEGPFNVETPPPSDSPELDPTVLLTRHLEHLASVDAHGGGAGRRLTAEAEAARPPTDAALPPPRVRFRRGQE